MVVVDEEGVRVELTDLLSFPWFRGGGKGREGREDAGLILDSHFALTQFRSESNLFQMGV